MRRLSGARMSIGKVIAALIAVVLVAPVAADAGGFGRGLGRGLTPGPSGKGKPFQGHSLLRRDVMRDRATPARPLPRPRTAERYTTREQARRELHRGIPPGRHMAPAHPGRPLSPEHAQKKYGLPRTPQVRESVRLPAGQPVRPNKTLGGAPGVGEWTSPRRVPPRSVTRVSPLGHPGRAWRE